MNILRAGVPERAAMMISDCKTALAFEGYNIVNMGNDSDPREAAQRQKVSDKNSLY